MRLLIIVVTILTVAAVNLAHAQQIGEGRITVTGVGTVEAVPDMAVMTLGVTKEAKDAKAALRETSDAVALILERLGEKGVDPRDVQTSDLSLTPVWSRYDNTNKPREITGFAASNRVTVRVRDLATLGGILDEVTTLGANTFNGLSFAVKEPKPLHDLARTKAVADAKDKAQQLARAAGIKLGAVISMSEQGNIPTPRPMMRASMAEAMDVPVAAGEVQFQNSVNMVFEIAE